MASTFSRKAINSSGYSLIEASHSHAFSFFGSSFAAQRSAVRADSRSPACAALTPSMRASLLFEESDPECDRLSSEICGGATDGVKSTSRRIINSGGSVRILSGQNCEFMEGRKRPLSTQFGSNISATEMHIAAIIPKSGNPCVYSD
jgi:hypothetical protein